MNLLLRAGGLFSLGLFLPSCAKEVSPPITLRESVRPAQQEAPTIDPKDLAELEKIEEQPVESYQVWLDKKYWENREIWLSVGVEKASLTGVAMSVIGYIPAQVRRAGAVLVVERRNKGLFGGSVLGPDLGINTYPITAENEEMIRVDIASPGSPYGLSSINFHAEYDSSTELAPRLEYLKSIDVGENQLSFHSVVTVKSPVALYKPGSGSVEELLGFDPYTLSMTLRTDWLTELPGSDTYETLENNPYTIGFFLEAPLLDGTEMRQYINRINTKEKMVWNMSANTPPAFRESIRDGILAWDESLGGGVLKVGLAPVGQSLTDPKTSNVVWDDNEAIGFAFANWRSNPYTGQIVQGQVYLSGQMWAENAKITLMLKSIEQEARKTYAGWEPKGEQIDDDTGPAPIVPPNAPITPVIANNAKIKSMLEEVLPRLEAADKAYKRSQGQKRMFIGLNLSMAQQKAESGTYCLRTPQNPAALLAKVKALKSLLESNSPTNGNNPVTASMFDFEDGADLLAFEELEEEEHEHENPSADADHTPYADEKMTEDQFSKAVVRSTVMHEVGHALGLRHNFMGSTGTSENGSVWSTSVMDYNDLVVDAQFSKPGAYDQAVVKATYGKGAPAFDYAYCSDPEANLGMPDCFRHDFGSNPTEGLKTAQETNLLLAQALMQMGNSDAAFSLLNYSFSSFADNINYAVFPSDVGVQLLGPEMLERQERVWKLIDQSDAMAGMDFPAEMGTAYRKIVFTILAEKVSPMTQTSILADRILESFEKLLISRKEAGDFYIRKAMVQGIINLQSADAYWTLIKAKDTLLANGQLLRLPVEKRVADLEMGRYIEAALEKGYYKDPQ